MSKDVPTAPRRDNLIELYVEKDGEFKRSGVYYCDKCKIVSNSTHSINCCGPWLCSECGKECRKHWLKCDECRKRNDERKEQERFDKAEKIAEKDWGSFVYDHRKDKWYEDTDELRMLAEDDDEELPPWVYGSTEIHAKVNADSITENIEENAYEDYECEAVDELQAFLDQWAAKQPVWYEVNYSKVILLDQPTSKIR